MQKTTAFEIGRESLRPFIVAVKHVCADGWPPAAGAALLEARERYCEGTHEMVQGRDGQTIIQYLIPRKTPVGPRDFPWAGIHSEAVAEAVS